MIKNIFTNNPQKVTCVVLCAGEGTRLLKDSPDNFKTAKAMLEINGLPLIRYVIDTWKEYADEFVFVVKFQKESIIDYINKLPIKAQFVEQKELRGIAHALLMTEEAVTDNFITVLGDCLIKGSFDFPPHLDMGVGVWHTDNPEYIHRSYSVEIEGDHITKVVEKPKELVNDLCGMGYYFFNKKVFDYIRKTPPSKLRGETEITDTLQLMIDKGEKLCPVNFSGDYLNITYKEDIEKAENIISE